MLVPSVTRCCSMETGQKPITTLLEEVRTGAAATFRLEKQRIEESGMVQGGRGCGTRCSKQLQHIFSSCGDESSKQLQHIFSSCLSPPAQPASAAQATSQLLCQVASLRTRPDLELLFEWPIKLHDQHGFT